jgi:hypothetical protein
MKTVLRIAGAFCVGAILPSAAADALDEAIDGMRKGTPVGAAIREQIVQRGLSATSSAYFNALADRYVSQVKASIIDEENHGGWPCRSSLIYNTSTRRSLTSFLKSRFDRKPNPVLAYALICPALFAKDDVLLKRAIAYLQTNDPFLHVRAEAQMRDFWSPFIADVLRRQSPPAKEPKDSPLSVLPR